jgi:plastocyanin
MKYIITIIGLIGIIIIVGFVVNRDSAQAPAPVENIIDLNEPQTMVEPPIDSVVIEVTEDGFEPADVTIKLGDTVTFVNTKDRVIWPASNDHPIHTDYPEFDPRRGFEKGDGWSFTFDRVGEWGYHDHVSPLDQGTITVTE